MKNDDDKWRNGGDEEEESGEGGRVKQEGEGGRGEEREERRRGKGKEENTDMDLPNTWALARTTLKITIGFLWRGPSKRFQGGCRFSTTKKNCPTVRLFGPCFKTGRTRPEKKNACTGGPSQAVLEMAAHARQASVK